MPSWAIKLAATSALLLAVASAHAQDEGRALARCTARRAVSVSVQELARHPDAYVGRCVSVRGLWAYNMLYADEEAYYLAPFQGSRGDGRFVGVYGDPLDRLEPTPVARARIVGVADTCARVWEVVELFAGGFCHSYLREAYIDAVSIDRLKPVRLIRRTSDRDRRVFGDLAVMPANWPRRDEIETLALRWLDAIERGDIAAAAELYGVPYDQARADVESSDGHERVSAFQYMFRVVDSPFADFRRPRETPQMALFVEKRHGAVAPSGFEDEGNWAVACFCRTDNCAGRWPISSLDARNALTRPFICANVDLSFPGIRRAVMPFIDGRTLLEP